MADTPTEKPPSVVNHLADVTTDAGVQAGVVHGGIHHYGRSRPHVVSDFPAPSSPDNGWLLEQPSRLLGARNQVVPFVGRETELRRLSDWRDADRDRLSVLLLHGPGGQGKTRLAYEFAEQSRRQAWRVLQTGASSSDSAPVDVTETDDAGVVLIIDYADTWALSELEQLLSNPVLQQERPARILLIGRTVQWFAALWGMLTDRRAGAADLLLQPLTVDRSAMFRAARDRFSELYDLEDRGAVSAPAALLDHPDFGLTLTVHMAALVAVDAYRRGLEAPTTPRELSAYLLDREYRAWHRLFETGALRGDFQTRPAVMARTVFIAALTGAMDQVSGKRAIRRLDLPGHPQALLDDHQFCYPSADRELVLEPLYPDRLAEDFIALFTPGHDISAYDSDPWARDVPAALLSNAEELRPLVVGRAMTFLASAAERWPHLGAKVLYPLLRTDPALALEAGSAALTSLAAIGDLPYDVLTSVERLLPPGRHIDLDIGAAAIACAVASRALPLADDPAEQAAIHTRLSNRLTAAGRRNEALEHSGRAVELGRQLVAADRFDARSALARSLSNHAIDLAAAGRYDEALQHAREAIGFLPDPDSPDFVMRALEAAGQVLGGSFWAEDLASAMNSCALALDQVGQRAKALAFSLHAVDLYERLSAAGHEGLEAALAVSLDNHAARLRKIGNAAESLASSTPGASDPEWTGFAGANDQLNAYTAPVKFHLSSEMQISIYLSDEAIHEQVEAAVEGLLATAGLQIESRDDPVIGSWFRRMLATVKEVAYSPAARETTLVAAHMADTRLVLAQDAAVTATLLQNLGPVLGALQPTKDAAVRAGALLIVKVDWTVHVFQLTAAQQAILDHRPQLAQSPHEIVAALDLTPEDHQGDGHPELT